MGTGAGASAADASAADASAADASAAGGSSRETPLPYGIDAVPTSVASGVERTDGVSPQSTGPTTHTPITVTVASGMYSLILYYIFSI